eukprot:8751137-Pyramimonas_sp.AAC.1
MARREGQQALLPRPLSELAPSPRYQLLVVADVHIAHRVIEGAQPHCRCTHRRLRSSFNDLQALAFDVLR